MKSKLVILTSFGICLLCISLIASVHIGAQTVSFQEIHDAIFFYDHSLNARLIRDIRIPRVLCAALTGGILALSGAMMQGVLRNPIAEPSTLGITQGAALALAISFISPFTGGIYGNFFMCLIGALISGSLILLFTMLSPSNQNISKILLAGTAMSTFFLSLASIVALLGNRSQELAFWIAGGFHQTDWKDFFFLLMIGGFFSILALFLSPQINLLSMGDEVAASLGISAANIKFRTIFYLIPLCGICVSVAGNIGFIGLFVPHIIRRLAGNDYRKLMPLSFLYGSIIVLFADMAARTIIEPYELPVGLFTSCIGVPIFLLLVRKERN